MDTFSVLKELCSSIYPYSIITASDGTIRVAGAYYPKQIVGHSIANFFSINQNELAIYLSKNSNLSAVRFSQNDITENFSGETKIYPSENIVYFALHLIEEDSVEKLQKELIKMDELRKQALYEKQFYISVLENIPSDIGVFDKEHRYLFVNQKGIRDPKVREFMFGKTDYDYCKLKNIDTGSADRRRGFFNRVMETGEEVVWEDTYTLANGQSQTISRRMTPGYDENHQLNFVIGYGFDISEIKKAELQIKKSEEKYKKLFDNNLSGVFVTDINGKFLEINASYAEIYGFSSVEELKKHNSGDFFVYLSELKSYLQKIKSEGKLVNYPLRNKRIDGKEIWVLMNVNLVISNGIQVIEGTLIDITEQRENESLILSSNKQLKLLENFLDQSTDALQVSKEDGKLIYINKAASKRLGISQKDISNYSVFDFESVFKTEKDWLDHVELIKEKGILILEGLNVNQRTKAIIPVEVSVRYQQINGEGYIIASSRDISERKAAQKEIDEKNRYLQQITNAINASSLVSFTDKDGIITMVNDEFCNTSQHSREELIGKTHSIVSSGFHTRSFWKDAWETILDKRIWSGDVKNKAKDGSTYWVRTVIYPILNSDNEIENFLSIRQNISKAKENEEHLEKQIALQNLIMNVATKFINTPIEGIEEAINTSLSEIGQFVKADRSYIFDYNLQNQTSSNLYEWCRDGISTQIEYLQNVPLSDMPDWIEKHFSNQPMDIPNVDNLPDGKLKELLAVQDIKSLLALPLIKQGKCIGFIGFDSVIDYYSYSVEDKKILTLFAEMLVNVTIRREHIQEIEKSKEQIRQINLNLEQEVIEKTQKNTELSRLLTDQEKLAMIGEISAGIAHDLNTPLGSIKVGTESVRYTLEGLFGTLLEKCTLDQLHFACGRRMEPNIQLFIGGLQARKEANSIEEYLKEKYPDLSIDYASLAINIVKARISIDEPEIITLIVESANPHDFLNLIYHIQTIRTFLDTILTASERATQVVKNLRSFVRYDQNSTKSEICLKDNISTVLNVFNYELTSKVELTFEVDANLIIEGYDIKLYQLWSNLIKNAIEAISVHGKIIIKGKKLSNSVEVSIENDGEVIPPEILSRMFTKFFTTKNKTNGTGLGLSIVQNVIEEHHAKIDVTSVPGNTRFVINFPIPKQNEKLSSKGNSEDNQLKN